MDTKKRYCTFPICLLKDVTPDNISDKLIYVIEYCLFVHTLNYSADDKSNQIKAAGKYLGFNSRNPSDSYDRGKRTYSLMPAKYPKVSISVTMITDFHRNHKTEFELVCFLMFAAIRSILQKKPYCRVTNEYLISRMHGNASQNEDKTNMILYPYNNRYQLEKIKKELSDHWGLKYFGKYTRGFYVSFDLEYNKLVFEVEKKRKSYLDKLRKDKEAEAIREARNILYNQ